MKTIYIDTSDNKEITVGLIIEGKKYLVKKKLDYRKGQIVLPLIEKLVQKYKLSLKDITSIEVNPGPGSFTGVRVGITIANALGFTLGIPVNNKHIVEPVYS